MRRPGICLRSRVTRWSSWPAFWPVPGSAGRCSISAPRSSRSRRPAAATRAARVGRLESAIWRMARTTTRLPISTLPTGQAVDRPRFRRTPRLPGFWVSSRMPTPRSRISGSAGQAVRARSRALVPARSAPRLLPHRGVRAERSDRASASYDCLILGLCGIMDFAGEPAGGPQEICGARIDIPTGLPGGIRIPPLGGETTGQTVQT